MYAMLKCCWDVDRLFVQFDCLVLVSDLDIERKVCVDSFKHNVVPNNVQVVYSLLLSIAILDYYSGVLHQVLERHETCSYLPEFDGITEQTLGNHGSVQYSRAV